MARTKTRYRTRVKRVYSRSRGGGGKFKPIIDGALAEVGGSFASNYLGSWGRPVAYGLVGTWRRNNTLTTMAGVALGQAVSGMLPGMGGGNGGNGGFFQS